MHDFYFHSLLLERKPGFSDHYFKEETWKDLLHDHFFNAAIRLASTSLYQELQKCQWDFEKLPVSVQQSLKRYLNRMCYRPVPFGLFASFSYAEWTGPDRHTTNEHARTGVIVHLMPDRRELASISLRLIKENTSSLLYYPNTSLYRTGNQWRYLAGNAAGGFVMRSLKAGFPIKALFNFCRNGKTRDSLLKFLMQRKFNEDEALQCIDGLIAFSLLLPQLAPALHTRRYASRLTEVLKDDDSTKQIIQPGTICINSRHHFPSPENLFKNSTREFVPAEGFYAVSETGGTFISSAWQDTIRDGLKALMVLGSPVKQPDLNRFKEQFFKRFEWQQIPLMEALDPEAGIGYGFEQQVASDILLNGLTFHKAVHSSSTSWEWKNKLLLRLIQGTKPGGAIHLEEDHLFPEEFDGAGLPSSLSVVFRLVGDKVFMEAAGANALAVPARFCLFNKDLHQQARSFARQEQDLSPQVVFAEVAFCKGDKTDNINSRPSFYDYEIPLMLHSDLPTDRQIPLNDLYLSLREDEMIMISKRLKKRIIPRMSSAYNYQASDLSVFRFLCDLQHQGLKQSFHLSLPALFPGLAYYPRVTYKNCILSAAQWIVNEEQLKSLREAESKDAAFTALALVLNLPRCFYIGEGDRQLLIDRRDPFSSNLLYDYIRKVEELRISEACFGNGTEKAAEVVTRQYVAALLNRNNVYESLAAKAVPVKAPRNFLPGDGWLYLRIYGHPASANKILIKLYRAIRKLRKNNSTWFYIRYADPAPHIRFRIQVGKGDQDGVLGRLMAQLKPFYNEGFVNDIQVVPYKRELERYTPEGIELAEQVFCASSELVIRYLQKSNDPADLIQFACISIAEASRIFIEDDQMETFLYGNFMGLYSGFGKGKELRIAMDQRYRELMCLIRGLGALSVPEWFEPWIRSLREYREKAALNPAFNSEKACSDLLHMHLNRIFSERQKENEMMVYFLLWKGRKVWKRACRMA